MTLYLLDTDHLSHYHRGNAVVRNYLIGKIPSQVFISMITAEEILRGRLAQIRAVKTEAEHIKACGRVVGKSGGKQR